MSNHDLVPDSELVNLRWPTGSQAPSLANVVEEILNHHDLTINFDENLTGPDGLEVPSGLIKSMFEVYSADALRERSPLRIYKTSHYLAYLSLFARRQQKKVLQGVADGIFDDTQLAPERELIEAARMALTLNDFIDPKTLRELDSLVLLQWMSNVKRNLALRTRKNSKLKLDNNNAMVLNFYSAQQGVGKSTFVKWLADPFKDSATAGVATTLLDQRAIAATTQHTIVRLDELQMLRHSRKEFEEFKGLLTESKVKARPMYGNKLEPFRIYASFATTSNESLFNIIKDPTGHRRYWEYDVNSANWERKVEEREMWQAALGSSADVLWKRVDYRQPQIYLTEERRIQMRRIQKASQVLSFTEEFLKGEDGLNAVPGDYGVAFKDLYSVYRSFANKHDEKPVSREELTLVLKTHSFRPHIRISDSDSRRGVGLSAEGLRRFNSLVKELNVPTAQQIKIAPQFGGNTK